MAVKDGFISAAEFTALKTKVKAEMLRRDGNGSVAGYGAVSYDYSNTPAEGEFIRVEHSDKLLEPLRAVSAEDLPESTSKFPSAGDLSIMETKLAVMETTPRGNRGASDCDAACTGMCVSACTTACTGCSGTCSGGCSGCSGCGSGCANGCTSCTGCSGSCSGCSGCGSGCVAACNNTCTGSGCQGNCNSACANACAYYS